MTVTLKFSPQLNHPFRSDSKIRICKSKEIKHQKMSSPGQKVSSMLLGKNRGQLLIPDRMKWLG